MEDTPQHDVDDDVRRVGLAFFCVTVESWWSCAWRYHVTLRNMTLLVVYHAAKLRDTAAHALEANREL
jgi:hypothetical protein